MRLKMKMINPSNKLMENLLNDDEYKQQINTYKEESYVNKDMLDSFLKKHLDLRLKGGI